jgi:hypothetical protein
LILIKPTFILIKAEAILVIIVSNTLHFIGSLKIPTLYVVEMFHAVEVIPYVTAFNNSLKIIHLSFDKKKMTINVYSNSKTKLKVLLSLWKMN